MSIYRHKGENDVYNSHSNSGIHRLTDPCSLEDRSRVIKDLEKTQRQDQILLLYNSNVVHKTSIEMFGFFPKWNVSMGVKLSVQRWSQRTAGRNASSGPQRAAGGTQRNGADAGWTSSPLSWPPPSAPASLRCPLRCRNLPSAFSDLPEGKRTAKTEHHYFVWTLGKLRIKACWHQKQ